MNEDDIRQRIELLDKEWRAKEALYSSKGSLPTKLKRNLSIAYFGLMLLVLFFLFVMNLGTNNKSNDSFSISSLLFFLALVGVSGMGMLRSIERTNGYFERKKAYENERNSLEEQLK